MKPHPRRPIAFTLIELLVVLSIIALLVGILLPVLGQAREQAKMIREMSAARSLMLAYRMYADDHDNHVVPGYRASPAFDDQGNALGNPENKRYPWKLAPYTDYQLYDCLLVNKRRADIEALQSNGFSYSYAVSVTPSFGLNVQYLGGSELFSWLPATRRVDDAADPSGLLVFASARSEPAGPGSLTEGYYEVRPPTVTTYNPDDPPFQFGFVHPRYNNAAVTAYLDGHAGTLQPDAFHDMRLWSDTAARLNDPDWAWTP